MLNIKIDERSDSDLLIYVHSMHSGHEEKKRTFFVITQLRT